MRAWREPSPRSAMCCIKRYSITPDICIKRGNLLEPRRNDPQGIAVVKTFWTRITRTNTKKHGFLKAFSVRFREIRAIRVRITEDPKEPFFGCGWMPRYSITLEKLSQSRRFCSAIFISPFGCGMNSALRGNELRYNSRSQNLLER